MNQKIVIKEFDTSATASSFKSNIERYFKDRFNENQGDYIVEKHLLNASKVVTTSIADSRYVQFTVHMKNTKSYPR